jgi:hypothetical protein
VTDSKRLTLGPSHPDVIDSAKLQENIQDAQARFNELSPEEQMFHRFAQKVSAACSSLKPGSLSKEDVARQLLTHEVSEKYAQWMLKKPRLREFLEI